MPNKVEALSYEYIRGLAEGEGCFTFHSTRRKADGTPYKLPAFVISLNFQDKDLLEKIQERLGLDTKLYYRGSSENIKNVKTGKGHLGGKYVILIVRDFGQLKDIIIPFFYKKLKGHKSEQFMQWLKSIGEDPGVSDRFKSLFRLYKLGVYDKPEFLNKFVD